MLTAYFAPATPAVHLAKAGSYYERIDAVLKAYPDARFLVVLRDPRGVFRSQKTSLDSASRAAMNANPALTACWFNRLCDVVRRPGLAGRLHVVRYETLLEEPDGTLRGVLDFLGVSDRKAVSAGDYHDAIPDAQKHLHELVNKPPQRDRATAWRDELSPVEIRAVQVVARKAMAEHGYEPIDVGPVGLGGRLRLLRWRLGVLRSRLLQRLYYWKHRNDGRRR